MSEAQSLFDFFSPKAKQMILLTDEEATFLYNLWKQGASNSLEVIASNSKCINALKTKGYLAGFGSGLEITPRGKKVIVEMVMHEPNSFDKKGQMPTYSGIKAKTASQRKRQTFLAKKASLDNCPVFNLYKRSLEKLNDNNNNKSSN